MTDKRYRMALEYGIANAVGDRKYMEDRYFVAKIDPDITWYAVLDGHGGERAVKFFKKKLPKVLKEELKNHTVRKAIRGAFRKVNEKWINHKKISRTTVVSVLITPRKIYTIAFGIARGLLRLHNRFACTIDPNYHNDDEVIRVQAYKEIYIKLDIIKYDRSEVIDIVLASAGLWKHLTYDDIADQLLHEYPSAQSLLEYATTQGLKTQKIRDNRRIGYQCSKHERSV